MLSHQEVEKTVEEMVEEKVEEMVVTSLQATRLQTCDHRGETFSLCWLCSLSSVLLINAVRFEPSIKSTQDKWIRKWSS